VGRTHFLASAAFGASEKVKDLLPVETRRRCTMWRREAFGREIPEVDVRRCEKHVAVLGPRNIDEKAQDRRHVRPVKGALAGVRRDSGGCRELGERARHRTPSGRRAAKNCKRRLEKHADYDRSNQKVDDKGVRLVRARKTSRPVDVTLVGGHGDADQHQDREDVLQQADPGIAAVVAQGKSRKQSGPESVNDRRKQDEERAEYQRMQHAREWALHQPPMKPDGFEDP
jgi:hypothetical protein